LATAPPWPDNDSSSTIGAEEDVDRCTSPCTWPTVSTRDLYLAFMDPWILGHILLLSWLNESLLNTKSNIAGILLFSRASTTDVQDVLISVAKLLKLGDSQVFEVVNCRRC